jgi:MEMO1 family protein
LRFAFPVSRFTSLDAMTGQLRPPAVAGSFYPAQPARLAALVQQLLGEPPAERRRALAVMVPHAGLVYSGACAGRVFGAVAIPPVVVVLAPNHTGRVAARGGASAWMRGAFDTPLGSVPVAEAFLAALLERCPLVEHDPTAHDGEHAIEVELPFLQTLAPEAALAPLVLAWDDWPSCQALGTALADTVRAWATPVLLVASSDMTHYEPAAVCQRKDRLALDALARLDGAELLATCRREKITMCGRAPAATVAEAARLLGAKRAEVVDYRNSGWVTGDESSVVAYAGVVIA